MEAYKFPEANVIFAEHQPEYLALPAHKDPDDPLGIVTTCYKLTWRDLWKLLFTRRIWWQQLTFNNPLQGQKPSIDKPLRT